ncbi:MAG: hypothetical protein AAF253_13410 [Pseudomonadota bacterium]
MFKKRVRWAADLGYQEKIRPYRSKAGMEQFGLKGERKTGELGMSRQKVKSEAKKDATDGIPVSEAMTKDQWSEQEQLIAVSAEEVRRGLGMWWSASSAEVRNFIEDASSPNSLTHEILKESIKAEANEITQFEDDDKEDAEEMRDSTIVELEAFRTENSSQIGKRTPDIKTNVEQTLAILIFVMILEGCFNALLFKDAQSSGLLGGMMVAFGVSAVNVLIGVVSGYCGLRFLNHTALPFKILGGVIATIGISAGLFLNFFVAHFRDAVELALQDAMAAGSLAGFSMFSIPPGQVIQDMFPNVFGLHSLVAFGLLAIGITVFAIAVYEGYDKISDKYPGYGRVWRKQRQAKEREQAIRSGYLDDLSTYYTECRIWFEQQQSRHVEAKREINKAINELETRRDQAVAFAAKAADQERTLVAAYRQAHRRQRMAMSEVLGAQAEVPVYFDEIVTPDLPEFRYDDEQKLALSAVQQIAENISELNRTREWLEKEIQEEQIKRRRKVNPNARRQGGSQQGGAPDVRQQQRAAAQQVSVKRA